MYPIHLGCVYNNIITCIRASLGYMYCRPEITCQNLIPSLFLFTRVSRYLPTYLPI